MTQSKLLRDISWDVSQANSVIVAFEERKREKQIYLISCPLTRRWPPLNGADAASTADTGYDPATVT